MSRPTRAYIDSAALIHNLEQIKKYAPGKKISAMVKANAYGCGLSSVIPVLEGEVDAFGVASIEEALAIRKLGSRTPCILFQGIFSSDELPIVENHNFELVIHTLYQLSWVLSTPLSSPIKVWIKINTGMHRLGFALVDVLSIIEQLKSCPWIQNKIGLMTHLACADEPLAIENEKQLQRFHSLKINPNNYELSIANSAAIMALPSTHADMVRPGIMLYGISPFSEQTGKELGLQPVMQFISSISAIHHYPPYAPVGYGATWQSNKPSVVGVVPAGYGDGYPRHVKNAYVWIKGQKIPVVGRVSMDMLTVDLTDFPDIQIGDTVELWGRNIPVENVAITAGTIAYELISQVAPRARV